MCQLLIQLIYKLAKNRSENPYSVGLYFNGDAIDFNDKDDTNKNKDAENELDDYNDVVHKKTDESFL